MNYKPRMDAENLYKHNSKRKKREVVTPNIVVPSAVQSLSVEESAKYGGILICNTDKTNLDIRFRHADPIRNQCEYFIRNATTGAQFAKLGKKVLKKSRT